MMLTQNQKGAIAVGSVFLVIGLGYFGYKLYSNHPLTNHQKNFLDLQNNLGLKPNSDNVIVTKFNEGKNIAQFYNNNRVFVFDENKKSIAKGAYSNGGKKIVLDDGFSIESGSVFGNLLGILKK